MKISLFVIAFSVSFTAIAADPQKITVTKQNISSGRTVQMKWHWEYEGFNTVHELKIIRSDGSEKALKVFGQPVLNRKNSLAAFKNCWHGGCNLNILIVDLENEKILQSIKLEQESFLKLEWIGERKLKVIQGGMYPGQEDKFRFFEF